MVFWYRGHRGSDDRSADGSASRRSNWGDNRSRERSANRSADRSGGDVVGHSDIVFVECTTARAIVVISVIRQRRAQRDTITIVVVNVCIEESGCDAVGPCRVGTRRFVSIFLRVRIFTRATYQVMMLVSEL